MAISDWTRGQLISAARTVLRALIRWASPVGRVVTRRLLAGHTRRTGTRKPS